MPPTDTSPDLRRSSTNPATLSMSEYAFADLNNLEHCAKYLNNTLVTFGFPASLDLFSNDPVSVSRTCNCIHALLQQRQRDVEFRESANEQRQRTHVSVSNHVDKEHSDLWSCNDGKELWQGSTRLLSDISRLEAKVERLESQLSTKDREIASMTRTEAKATAAFKTQIDKLQQERDEFQKMVLGNQQVKTQQIHEMKKKEKEYVKLQERLNQVVMEKKKESRSGMEIMNLLQKEGRQRGTWTGKKADTDFYKKIVETCEAKNQELMAENADLRILLRSMQADMREFLNAPNGKQSSPVNTRSDADLSQSPLVGRTDMFDLPLHMGRDQIEESLRTKMSSIKDRMVQLQDAHKGAEFTSEVSERELELEAQLVEARSIIQEQESIMSKHIPRSNKPRYVSTDHSPSSTLPHA
ncbi:hypothetical protein SASPL_156958 [Salvia splendens]|uniref:Afadin-and alpha-actinin-binding protein n=1 Tax=Salvia splendens TaxID=180675 RepID=A0A8X8YVW3_SALSN|nr:hypothetical protein SASPL_156958 [Salvia splendens]